VFPEGTDPKVIWAASEIVRERIAKPVLLGKKDEILKIFEELHHDADGIEIIEPKTSFRRQVYVNEYFRTHQRKGVSLERASLDMRNYINFGAMMVHMGDADGMVAGVTQSFHEVLQPALRIVGPRKKGGLVAGMYMLLQDHKLYCLADCSVNINPTSDELASIVKLAAGELRSLDIDPVIAMLSFSNFGTVLSPESEKVAKAVEIIKETRPDLIIDGPVQGDIALDTEFIKKRFPFSDLTTQPNLLIFPTLDAGNISLRLLRKLGKAHTIGPIMIGMAKPIQILPVGVDVSQIINLTALAAVDAQELAKREKGEPQIESMLV
jgi:malate dehydrogenase (oxaloacetate-decarboxylating)(NADP+)